MIHTPTQQHNPATPAWQPAAREPQDILLQYRLVDLANAARLSLERLTDAERGQVLELDGFPQGAGGLATELFGRLLLERTGFEGSYVCGTFHPALPQHQSHAWLEVEGLIVDLTHDQFTGTGLEGWVFRTSPWHDQFSCDAVPLSMLPERHVQYPHAAYAAMARTAESLGR